MVCGTSPLCKEGRCALMRKCKQCGEPIPRGEKRCSKCGAPVAPRRRGPVIVILISLVVILASACVVAWRLGALDALIGGGSSGGGGTDGSGQEVQTASDEQADGSGDDDPFVLLQTGFTTEKITSEASARSVIAGVADKLGIGDVNSELVDCSESEALDNRYWRFSQSYEGIDVYGRGVTVGADEDGNALLLSSNFLNVDGISTTPAVSSDDAEAAALADTDDDDATAVAGGTAIYSIGDVEPCLAWQVVRVSTDGIELVFVSADTAEVVGSEPLILEESARGTATDTHTGEEISFNVWHDDDDSYRMFDDERKIDVYDADGCTLSFEVVFEGADGTRYYCDVKDDQWRTDSGKVSEDEVDGQAHFVGLALDVNNIFRDLAAVTSSTTEFSNDTAASALVRVNAAYDFYSNILGREGFDGHGGHVDLVVNDLMWEGLKIDSGNAYSYTPVGPISTLLSIGSDNEGDIDTIAHEYTHSVEASISWMVSKGESGALKEGTSDIMAELIEDYLDDSSLDGGMDWMHGIRNLVDPSRSTASEYGDGNSAHPTSYGDERWGDPNGSHDNGYVHNNSTVISHAAYLMCTDSGLDGDTLSSEQMARLLYGTFHALTSDSTFSQFRNCMELTARIMQNQGLLSEENVQRISAAFNEVNISPADNNDFMAGDKEGETEQEVQQAVTAVQGMRDVALVLDVSSSMSGEPIEAVKSAASTFVERTVSEDVRVGLVAYSSTATTLAPLSSNDGSLSYAISLLSARDNTGMEDGLKKGAAMLASDDDRSKILVLMSDGLPNEGLVGDELVAYADELKDRGIKIYTLAFVDDAEGMALLESLASPGCYYYVSDADALEGFFGDIAQEINGTMFTYVEAACPVDVTVTYNGETLSSAEDGFNERTSFGTLVVQDSGEEDGTTTKILRLVEGPDYNIEIVGTGSGSMDYRIGYMDEQGDYTDYRTFSGVEVEEGTRVLTSAARSDETVLSVDEDGDGVFDLALSATSGGEGARVDNSGVAIGVTVGCVVVAAGGVALRVRSLRRSWKKAA